MVKPKSTLEVDTALRNREFEIQLFWQRANYFLVLITALGIGVFTVEKPILALLISLFGVTTCWLWFLTNLGSRFWQEFWENEVEKLSYSHDIKAFQISTDEIKTEMQDKLHLSQRKFGMRRWIDHMVMKKPSVTYNMILLSFAALVFWTFVVAFHLWELISPMMGESTRSVS